MAEGGRALVPLGCRRVAVLRWPGPWIQWVVAPVVLLVPVAASGDGASGRCSVAAASASRLRSVRLGWVGVAALPPLLAGDTQLACRSLAGSCAPLVAALRWRVAGSGRWPDLARRRCCWPASTAARCSGGPCTTMVRLLCRGCAGQWRLRALEVLIGVGQVRWSEVVLLRAKVWPVLAGRRRRRLWASLSFLEAPSRRSANPLLPDRVLQVKAKILM